MFEDIRRRIALSFGKKEHLFGRLLFWPIIIGMLINFDLHDNLNFYIFLVTFIFWLIYIISHTLEKKFYGNHGFR